MKPLYTSNEMIQFVAHFDVSKIYEIKKKKKHFKSFYWLRKTFKKIQHQ